MPDSLIISLVFLTDSRKGAASMKNSDQSGTNNHAVLHHGASARWIAIPFTVAAVMLFLALIFDWV